MVVVIAMAEKKKGEAIGSFRHTFARNEGSDHPVQQTVYVNTIGGVEKDTEYFVELKNPGKSAVDFSEIEPFIVKTHNGQTSFSIPLEIIKEHGILTGHCAIIKIYEVNEVESPTIECTDSSLIGRAEVSSDASMTDGCHSALRNKHISSYIGDDEVYLKFRNLKNGKDASAYISQNAREYEFSFPISVRKAIDAEPGDLIEVISKRDQRRECTENIDRDEKIDEMYEMVSELYDAYTAAKND